MLGCLRRIQPVVDDPDQSKLKEGQRLVNLTQNELWTGAA